MRGFTLIELVVTLLLISILAVSIWPRAPSSESITLNGRAEQLASDIRYVQTLSMTRGSRFCIVISGTGYELQTTSSNTCNSGAANREPHAGGLAQPIPVCSSCSLTATTVQFDGLGAPANSTGTALASDTVITISDDGGTKTVTISPVTGRVIVQ